MNGTASRYFFGKTSDRRLPGYREPRVQIPRFWLFSGIHVGGRVRRAVLPSGGRLVTRHNLL
jgi:hypothetical protein